MKFVKLNCLSLWYIWVMLCHMKNTRLHKKDAVSTTRICKYVAEYSFHVQGAVKKTKI